MNHPCRRCGSAESEIRFHLWGTPVGVPLCDVCFDIVQGPDFAEIAPPLELSDDDLYEATFDPFDGLSGEALRSPVQPNRAPLTPPPGVLRREWTVEGSKGKTYHVTQAGDIWRCTCPAFAYRGGPCKHIAPLQEVKP